jgi:hypothetical protein
MTVGFLVSSHDGFDTVGHGTSAFVVFALLFGDGTLLSDKHATLASRS